MGAFPVCPTPLITAAVHVKYNAGQTGNDSVIKSILFLLMYLN